MSHVAEIDLAGAEEVLSRFPDAQESDLIPILQETQETYGYLPEPVIQKISDVTRIPMARIYGVATFYAQFYLAAHGKHTVRCCRGTACHVRGAKKVFAVVKQQLGIGEGESTEDMQFTLETVACLGACALAPVIMVGPTYYGKMTPGKVKTILAGYAKT